MASNINRIIFTLRWSCARCNVQLPDPLIPLFGQKLLQLYVELAKFNRGSGNVKLVSSVISNHLVHYGYLFIALGDVIVEGIVLT